jgi:hypothetical protein
MKACHTLAVMAGLDPAIHVDPRKRARIRSLRRTHVDTRVKPGHDGMMGKGR